MNRFINLKHLCLLTASVLAQASWASSYYVLPTKAVGISPATAESEYELLRSSLLRHGEQLSAAEAGADFSLSSKLVGLGNSTILQVEKRKGATVVFASELKTTEVSELDRVTDRMVRAVLSGQNSNQEANMDEVTQNESAKDDARLPARKHWQVGFGPAWGTNINSSSYLGNIKIAYDWQVKNYDLGFFMKSSGSFMGSDSDAAFGILGVGGSYYLNQNAMTPFVSAGFGVGSASATPLTARGIPPEVTGFGLSVGGGYAFLRTSAVNFELYGEMLCILKASSLGMPIVSHFGVAINF